MLFCSVWYEYNRKFSEDVIEFCFQNILVQTSTYIYFSIEKYFDYQAHSHSRIQKDNQAIMSSSSTAIVCVEGNDEHVTNHQQAVKDSKFVHTTFLLLTSLCSFTNATSTLLW